MSSNVKSTRAVPTILIVDDEAEMRNALKTSLIKEGYHVAEASSADIALETARNRRPELVVTDVLMPEMDGFEFVQKLRAEASMRLIPVIMCSGTMLDESSRALARRHNIQGFWEKTSSTSLLFDLIRTALREKIVPASGLADLELEKDRQRLMADTLQRKLTELEVSEDKFRLLVESIKDYAFILLDPEGMAASWNSGARRMFGYDEHEIIGRHISSFCRSKSDENNQMYRLLKRVKEVGSVETEDWLLRKDGAGFCADIVINAIRDRQGRMRGFATIIRDITKQKLAKQKTERLLEQLRQLSRRMERIREEERISIAREIHDELGQSLTALKMDLIHLECSRPQLKRDLAEHFQSMHGIIDGTIKVVQGIASELRLGHLEELGLEAAIDWQLQKFQSRAGIHCELRVSGDIDSVASNLAICAYRILQESLTNVARHSGASKVTVALELDNRSFFLEVRDNGRGITSEQIDDKRSIGLLGMQERAKALGGAVNVRTLTPPGTVVELVVPVEPGIGVRV